MHLPRRRLTTPGLLLFFELHYPHTADGKLRLEPAQVLETYWVAIDPAAGDTLPTQPEDFAGAVSFEAWISPAENEAGRILDELTPGRDDGFLFDAWPGASLRLIVGGKTLTWPKIMTPKVWQHVAVVIEHGALRVDLDGLPARSGR